MKYSTRSTRPLKLIQPGPHPKSVLPPVRRLLRDAWPLARADDQPGYYRAPMRSDAGRGHETAVRSPTHKAWLRIGRLQFDYLNGHGLKPRESHARDRLWRAPGQPALHRVPRCRSLLRNRPVTGNPPLRTAVPGPAPLQAKATHLAVVDDLALDFLPEAYVDVVHAHAVFQHCTLDVIDQCLAAVRRILASSGFFDFTFDLVDGREYHVLLEDFYYRAETLMETAARHGLTARFMDDWETLPHRQSTRRLTAAH